MDLQANSRVDLCTLRERELATEVGQEQILKVHLETTDSYFG